MPRDGGQREVQRKNSPTARGQGAGSRGRNKLWAGWRVSGGSAMPEGREGLLGSGVRKLCSWDAGEENIEAMWGDM